jgi:cytochrome c553
MKPLFLTALLAISIYAQSLYDKPLGWAYPQPDPTPAVQPTAEKKTLPGSTKSMTQAQIDDSFAPPDWFPSEHAPLPSVVASGVQAQACGSCHLMSGMGHPESATIAGQPRDYMIRQMRDFKANLRKDPAGYEPSVRAMRMNIIAAGLPEEKMIEAIDFYANMKPEVWYKVVEADTVPKSWVNASRMRLPLPAGGTEPLGNRIVTLPQDAERTERRDPHAGFIAYVPKGFLRRGEALSKGGDGKTIACATCHGEGLKGLGDVPRLVNIHPMYIVRQLHNMQNGGYPTTAAAQMKKVVEKLTDEDIMALAAYCGSLQP